MLATAPKDGHDMSQFTDSSYAKLFQKEFDWRKNQRCPLNFVKPKALFEETDIVSDIFTL